MRFSSAALASTLIASAALVACGDDGGSNKPVDAPIHVIDSPHTTIDSPTTVIDSPTTIDSPNSNNCVGATTIADYGTATLANQFAQVDDATTPNEIDYQGDLNADATPDDLFIQLFNTYGVYEDGITTGSVNITGDETQYATCGACVLILTDVNTTSGQPTDTYLAQSGTLNVTSINNTFTATLTNAVLSHVTIASSTSTIVGDCDVTIASATISATLQAGRMINPHTVLHGVKRVRHNANSHL